MGWEGSILEIITQGVEYLTTEYGSQWDVYSEDQKESFVDMSLDDSFDIAVKSIETAQPYKPGQIFRQFISSVDQGNTYDNWYSANPWVDSHIEKFEKKYGFGFWDYAPKPNIFNKITTLTTGPNRYYYYAGAVILFLLIVAAILKFTKK